MAVRTLVVGESALLRGGITFLLRNTRYEVVAAAASVREIGAFYPDEVDLVIVGAGAGNLTSAVIREVREILPQATIVAIAEGANACDAEVLLRNGADGFILDLTTDEVLLKSLDLALLRQRFIVIGGSGEPAYRAAAEGDGGETATPLTLSEFECQILRCLAQGESNKTIARRCSVSEAAVKSRVKAILRKIGAHNRTQAAIWALEHAI